MNIEPHYHDDFGDYELDIDPFTTFNWKSADARDVWSEYKKGMRAAKDEAEWRSVLDNQTDRKAAIIHVNNFNREEWLRRVGEYDLHYRDIRFSRPYQGFSHEFLPAEPNDPERITYAVIAENSDIADKMEELETNNGGSGRHDGVGELLGFPDCCRKFFNDIWLADNEQDVHIRDPMYEITCNSDNVEKVDDSPEHLIVNDPNPGACVMWRYYGISYLTHMPCSWDCEKSIELARNRYRIMAENGYEEAADMIHQWLSQPFKWSGYHGLAHVENEYATTETNTANYLNEKIVEWNPQTDSEE